MPSDTRDKPLLILGTRPMSAEIADVAAEVPGWTVAGFVENEDQARCAEPFEGLPVHWVDDLGALKDSHWAVGGLMTTQRARFTGQVEAIGMPFATIVHPMARVSTKAVLGDGCIVGPGAVIAVHARLGQHVFLNRGALVGHDTKIGDHSSLGPGANVAGWCEVAARVYLGSGAIVVDHVKIGAGSVIGAGALVLRDLPARVKAFGSPAEIVEKDIDGK